MVICHKLLHSQISYLVPKYNTISNNWWYKPILPWPKVKSQFKAKGHRRGGVCVLWILLVIIAFICLHVRACVCVLACVCMCVLAYVCVDKWNSIHRDVWIIMQFSIYRCLSQMTFVSEISLSHNTNFSIRKYFVVLQWREILFVKAPTEASTAPLFQPICIIFFTFSNVMEMFNFCCPYAHHPI